MISIVSKTWNRASLSRRITSILNDHQCRRGVIATRTAFDSETTQLSTKKQPAATATATTADVESMKNLASIQSAYMDKLNKRTTEKHQREKRLKTHYRITGTLLATFVLTVYFYSMYAVSQEKFLDDFQVPEPPNK